MIKNEFSDRAAAEKMFDAAVDASCQTIAKPPVSRRAWLFQGTNEQKFPITIYVSAVDRESAIAHFETDYPQYNWFATVECPLLCG